MQLGTRNIERSCHLCCKGVGKMSPYDIVKISQQLLFEFSESGRGANLVAEILP
jgi:hypothetical protein